MERCHIDDLSEDLLLKCMEFLVVKDLTAGMRVSSSWYRACGDDALWVELCRERWKNKQNYKLTPAKERRLNRHKHETPWRRLYAMAEVDSKRTRITVEELCSLRWVFSDGLQYPIFHPNHLLEMELYPLMHWSFNADHTLQIQSFPPHNFLRHAEDWSWIIRNQNISMYSLETPWDDEPDSPTEDDLDTSDDHSHAPARTLVLDTHSTPAERDGDSEMRPASSPSGSPGASRKRRLSRRSPGQAPIFTKRKKDSEDLKSSAHGTRQPEVSAQSEREDLEQRLARRTARLQNMAKQPVSVAGYGNVPHHVLISMLRDIQRQQIHFDDDEIPHWLRSSPGSSRPASSAAAAPVEDDDEQPETEEPAPEVALPASLSAPFAAITLAPEVTANLRRVHSQAQARSEQKQRPHHERKSAAPASASATPSSRPTPWPASPPRSAPPASTTSAAVAPGRPAQPASRPIPPHEINEAIAWQASGASVDAASSVSSASGTSASSSGSGSSSVAGNLNMSSFLPVPVINLAEVVLHQHLHSYLASAPASVAPSTSDALAFDVSLPPSVSSALPSTATAIMPISGSGSRSLVQSAGVNDPGSVNSGVVALFPAASPSTTASPLLDPVVLSSPSTSTQRARTPQPAPPRQSSSHSSAAAALTRH